MVNKTETQKSYRPPPQQQGTQHRFSSPQRQTFVQQQQVQNQSQNQNQQQQQQQPFVGFKLAGSKAFLHSDDQNNMVGHRASQRWSIEQLRASDAIIPLQSGTNQFASQRGLTGFGRPRNTITAVQGGIEMFDRPSDAVVPLQYGTNQYASQRGMTGFGAPRDVTGKHLHRLWEETMPQPQQAEWSVQQ